jgi:hypothetical protein
MVMAGRSPVGGRPFQGWPQSVSIDPGVLVGKEMPVRSISLCGPTEVMLQALTEPLWAFDWRLRPRLARGRGNQNDLALALMGTFVVMMRHLVALSIDVQSKTREPSGQTGRDP